MDSRVVRQGPGALRMPIRLPVAARGFENGKSGWFAKPQAAVGAPPPRPNRSPASPITSRSPGLIASGRAREARP
jgi:hypothetical protein